MSITFVSILRPTSYDFTHAMLYEGQDGRGMVVRVYCVPGMDAAELTRNAAELINYENGVWGKYFN
jgi:hypothetical protein